MARLPTPEEMLCRPEKVESLAKALWAAIGSEQVSAHEAELALRIIVRNLGGAQRGRENSERFIALLRRRDH